MLKITYAKKASKTLRTMQPRTAHRILAAIEKLAEDPVRADLDIKAMRGRDGCRLRIGDWRVIYTHDDIVLDIEKIAPRGEAYG